MSDYGSLIVTVGNPPTDDGVHGFVKLEQGPIDTYQGYLTKLQAVSYLSHVLFKTPAPAENCDDVGLSMLVYAYPSRPGLGFRVGTSRGSLVSVGIEPYEKTEIINVNMETAVRLDTYPGTVQGIWEGPVFNEIGDEVVPPIISATLPEPVYGTMVVTYRGWRHVYELTATPDPDAYENALQTIVYAVWAGGVNGLELTIPDGAVGGECNNRIGGGGGIADIISPEGQPGYVSGENTTHRVDYCSGEVI